MTILLSAGAGRGAIRHSRQFLDAFVRSRGIVPTIHVIRRGEEIARLVEQALKGGEKLIVAGGGDGTVSAVAGALAGSEAALGVLPLGTLNHFAKDLGIPIDLEAAARLLLTGRIARVDVGEVNGRVFLNNSSLGLYPAAVVERDRKRRVGWNKWVALAWAAANLFRRMPLWSVRLETEGDETERLTPFVFVGNNEYRFEPPSFGARTRLDAGMLWVYVAPHRPSRLHMLRLAVLALVGRLRDDKDFFIAQAAEFRVETARKHLRVSLDGEVVRMAPPLEYRIRPLALDVVVPGPEE